MKVIHKTVGNINIVGIDNHELTGLDVVTVSTVLQTNPGKIIVIFNKYFYLGKGSSSHSQAQMEWFKVASVVARQDTGQFCKILKQKYRFKLKRLGLLKYHVGCSYKGDPDGTLVADPRNFVMKIHKSYKRLLGEKPKEVRPGAGDHPELDTSEVCNETEIEHFQSLIG